MTKNQFDNKTREYAKLVKQELGGGLNAMTYFTKMPDNWRVRYIEDEKQISIVLYQDKTLEQLKDG